MFALLNRVKDISRGDLPSLKYCISGGAPLPVEVMEEFERKFGVAIYEGDGPTECSPVTSVNPIGGKRKPGSIGLPIKNVEMEIADDQGNFLPPGQIGEIVVRGPNVFLGYYKDPEATKQAFFGDWFRTGDLGKKDEEGYFYIIDRKKDMIIVDGLNVYPREIEELLYKLPQVAEAAVVGRAHPLHGEIPVAFVALKEGFSWDEDHVKEYLRERLAQYKIPRKFYILDSLPKTPTGKISKVELRRFLEDNL
jgi:long-chain acyl-CoA synthetase